MRRRAAQAASKASAHALSAVALRPLLFVLVSLFLVLPMLVYNFATLDAAQLRRWTESVQSTRRQRGHDAAAIAALPTGLRTCAAIRRHNLSSSETVDAVRQQCFTPDKLYAPSDMAHFVYLPAHLVPLLQGEARPPVENFTMTQFAAVQSVRKHGKPSLMVLHYPATEPRSFWYTQCQRHLSLHRVLFPKLPTATRSSLSIVQRRDVMQLIIALGALRVHGGVAFTDFNAFLLRPTRLARQLPLVLSRVHGPAFAIAPTMLSARAGNTHVAYIEESLVRMLETDDRRLRTTPLDQLLGELLVESITKTAGDAIPNVALLAPTVVDALDDVHADALIETRPADTTLSLRDAIAIHLPTHETSVAKAFQSRVADFDALANEPSALSALLRFSISLNETNELDGLL